MITRKILLGLAATAALVFSGCGGGDDEAGSESVPFTEVPAETAPEAPADTAAPDDTDGGADDSTTGDEVAVSCDQVLTADEVGAAFGSSPEISGSDALCDFTFDSGSVASLQVISGPASEEGFTSLMQSQGSDSVMLDDGRGYVLPDTAVVRGPSGPTFIFAFPVTDEMADQAAMEDIADLLVTR